MLNVDILLYAPPEQIEILTEALERRDIRTEFVNVIQECGPPKRLILGNRSLESLRCVQLLNSQEVFNDLENYFCSETNACILNDLSLALGRDGVQLSVAIGLHSGHSKWVLADTLPGGLYNLVELFERTHSGGAEAFPDFGVVIDFFQSPNRST